MVSNVNVGLYEYRENTEDTQRVIKVDHAGRQGWVGGMKVTVKRESDKEKQYLKCFIYITLRERERERERENMNE